MRFLPAVPNWATGLRSTYEFQTTVEAWEDGTEQRRAIRQSPRRYLEFGAWLKRDRYREVEAMLRRPSAEHFSVPDVGRPDAPAVSAASGYSATLLDALPSWLVAGAQVAVVDGIRVDLRTVSGASGDSVGFSTALSSPFASGTRIYPVVEADIGSGPQVTAATAELVTLTWNLAIVPGAAAEDYGDPAAEHDDREIWLRRPNWAAPLQSTFVQPIDRIDHGYGLPGRYAPVAVAPRITRTSHLLRSRAEIAELVAFFGRCRGRRGEFFAPTWLSDMNLAEPVLDAATTMRVTTPNLATRHPSTTVYRDILIDTWANGLLPRRVTIGASDDTGSTLTVTEGLPALSPGDVAQICWLPLCRQGSDSLTLDFASESVASATLSPYALEWKAAP